ncbi:exosome complex component Rrp42p [[Candida] railenensis]|uniref:Ribosomal RNA-processing protein 42 n=1 Tax=[Candida] railenensis TaxID=45579 RepID=A0A9P0QT42_9ASCO|nr:exosome complex component Rrp42p [[Candida] railenensis]
MILSPAERSYLYDSLIQKPPIRPDSRSGHQFRPLEAKTAFLPSSNGSARIRLMDGSECIVSVKAKVVLKSQESSLIECDIDVSGNRDDSNFVSILKFNLTNLLCQNFPMDVLQLTSKYSYKLFIDCLVISHTSYPLTLLSLATYLALKTTRLPLLVSDVDDSEVEEQPTFSDDWDKSKYLKEMVSSNSKFQPPIFITLGVVGDNLLFDPSTEEEQVLENGLILSWYNNKVITPISNINLASNSNNSNFKGMDPILISKSLALLKKYCGEIVDALDGIIEHDDATEGGIF